MFGWTTLCMTTGLAVYGEVLVLGSVAGFYWLTWIWGVPESSPRSAGGTVFSYKQSHRKPLQECHQPHAPAIILVSA
jgi:hypothetical protein